MNRKMKDKGRLSLFGAEQRLTALTEQGDPLVLLDGLVDWEAFRPLVEKTLRRDKMVNSGRRPYDPLLMFKILVVQRLYNLSDGQTQYQILDRRSFSRFLGLTESDDVPDEKTIWLFRERMVKAGLLEEAFEYFTQSLVEGGYIANEGRMIDASFVKAPVQRNSRHENKVIKGGGRPEQWKDSPAKDRQKDTDATWTKKGGVNHYGYKQHIKSDTTDKFILSTAMSEASLHDSQMLSELLDEDTDAGQDLYADSAYTGKKQRAVLKKKKVKDMIHEKGTRSKSLTEEQKEANTEKSRTRARVEHIFGFIENSMGGLRLRSIGMVRAEAFGYLTALVYNICRYIQVVRLGTCVPATK